MMLRYAAVLLLAVVYLIHELARPDLLIVGNVTLDLVDGTTSAGGAVSYAAAAARAFGALACIVTVAGPDASLSPLEDHQLFVIKSESTLTFEHTYTWWGHQRKLRVTANPNITITKQHVPKWCWKARTVLLGPLTLHDVDAASFLKQTELWDWLVNRGQQVGLLGQGFQRQLGELGEVLPLEQPSAQLLQGLGPRVSLFLSDVETGSWPNGTVEQLAQRTARLVVTRGEKGAVEYDPAGSQRLIPPVQVEAVDTNGAGDTFATMYMLALSRGEQDPGALASLAASRAVMQPQTCKPDCAPKLFEGVIRPLSVMDRVKLSTTNRATLALVSALRQCMGLMGQAPAAILQIVLRLVPASARQFMQQLMPAPVLQAAQQLGWWGSSTSVD